MSEYISSSDARSLAIAYDAYQEARGKAWCAIGVDGKAPQHLLDSLSTWALMLQKIQRRTGITLVPNGQLVRHISGKSVVSQFE